MTVKLHFTHQEPTGVELAAHVYIGHKQALEHQQMADLLPQGASALWETLVSSLSPGDKSDGTGTWLAGESPKRLFIGALPSACSRHNSPAHPHALTGLAKKGAASKGNSEIVIALDDPAHALASGCAVARAFPLYSSKTSEKPKAPRDIYVRFVCAEGEVSNLEQVEAAADAVRLAGRLVDMPTSELHTDAFVQEAQQVADTYESVDITVIRGKELQEQGFGGLWNVGKTATHPPALVILAHRPKGASKNIVWVGKGIVYDTGGLSIKGKTGMPGMKGDMGGAAGVLGAFDAAVRTNFSENLYALLCLAENSVGPESLRPDDIITMYSGRTVEVNNTDAEGRLVLADGVAYAVKHLDPHTIVNMATLTGAQLVTTGRKHAAIMCNDEDLEIKACQAGRLSGDLVHPIPYCPEFFRSEFKSPVADMKNSVKDRMNAQSSCAGQFIGDHLGKYDGLWMHTDIAGPADNNDRGTGYGVALLLTLFS